MKRETKYFASGKGTATPWGRADYVEKYAPGINSYGTPGHGGFKLSAGRNALVDPKVRNDKGWYEEDCDWAIVALTFPDVFDARELGYARSTVRRYRPVEAAVVFGLGVIYEAAEIVEDRGRGDNGKGGPKWGEGCREVVVRYKPLVRGPVKAVYRALVLRDTPFTIYYGGGKKREYGSTLENLLDDSKYICFVSEEESKVSTTHRGLKRLEAKWLKEARAAIAKANAA